MDDIERLYNLQDKVLESLSEFAQQNEFPFNLTGGTALVRFYARNPYRVSYDLDFFSTTSIKDFDFQNLLCFLEKKDLKIQEAKVSETIYQVYIGRGYELIRVDFVEDVFSGAFEGVKLMDLNIEIEPVYAIYTRKIWALASALHSKGTNWERIKDILDLIELEKIYKPFEEFFAGEFRIITTQNGIKISSGKMVAYLQFIEETILNNYSQFETLTKKEYRAILSVEEILKWLKNKQLALKKRMKNKP